MEKSVIEKFQSVIKKKLIDQAKNSFKVQIEQSNIIIASDSLSFGIAIASHKEKHEDVSQFALVKVFNCLEKKKTTSLTL